MEASIGVIGGSGLYEIDGFTDVQEHRLSTPFGDPSDPFIVGLLEGKKVAFLPRHGKGHRYLPHEINYQANIFGFKLLGVERIISLTAVGSMREDIKPMDMVLIDQFFDRTKNRKCTFFGEGIAAHISFDKPTCTALSELVEIDQRIDQHLKALEKADEVRRRAILETFISLDKSLRLIIENKQVIHGHLEGRSAFPPITNFEDAIRWLKENNEMLKEQFELAKEIIEEARAQFETSP